MSPCHYLHVVVNIHAVLRTNTLKHVYIYKCVDYIQDILYIYIYRMWVDEYNYKCIHLELQIHV